MIQLEYTNDLTTAGLSHEAATVYETLLKLGTVPASRIAKEIPASLSRPLVYKVLDELIASNLAEKNAPTGKVATFTAKHPLGIMERIDAKKVEIETIKQRFGITAGKLSSLFNLTAGKPGVQFFEGKDGVWEVLMDSLTATEEILSYADIEAVTKYIPELNAEYSALREEKGVKKRVMFADSPAGRKFIASYDHNVTRAKLMKTTTDRPYFQTVVQMYDNKTSYITLTDNYLVGFIISDQFVADTHKFVFESLWDLSQGEEI